MIKIIDKFGFRPDEIEINAHCCDGEKTELISVVLNCEHELKLMNDEEVLHTFVCSPRELGELCAGWLYSEGFSAESVTISEDGNVASAVGVCLREDSLKKVSSEKNIAADTKEMLELFAKASDKYSRSHGIHECVIKGADWYVICTDIGRHNAIDKAIGTALKNGYDLDGAVMFSSGRINEQTVRKAVRCGIGCLMSKAVITKQALALGEELGIKILFSVKKDGFLMK